MGTAFAIFDLLKPFWGYVVGAVGIIGGLLTIYAKGKESQKLKDENSTLKETINANNARTTVEGSTAARPDSANDSMLHTWDRDK